MSIGRKVASGSLANTFSIGMNAVLQLLMVPVLVSAWGAERFGFWMMLTTIPTYFALTDLGFVQASSSDMTMQFANGDKARVVATFQSSLMLIFLICVATVSIVSGAVLLWSNWMGPVDNPVLIVLLATYAGVSLLSRMSLCSLLATGHYAFGTLVYNSVIMIEGLAALLTAFVGGGFEEVAICLLLMRLVNMSTIYGIALYKVPWLRYGFAHASRSELRRLLKPAIAAMTIPVALSINLQGVVLIIGAVLSPAAVAVYTPVRTCSRLLIQAIGVVNRASMPEISRAFALSDKEGIAKIVRLNCLMIVLLLLPGSLAFALIGRIFVDIWSAGHIVPEYSFVALMALATLVHGSWYFASNLLLATNAHVSFAKYSLAASILTLFLVFFLCRYLGLDGAGLGLVIGEGLCVAAVSRIFFSTHRRTLWEK